MHRDYEPGLADTGQDGAGEAVVGGLVDLVDLAVDGERLGAVGGSVQGERTFSPDAPGEMQLGERVTK